MNENKEVKESDDDGELTLEEVEKHSAFGDKIIEENLAELEAKINEIGGHDMGLQNHITHC